MNFTRKQKIYIVIIYILFILLFPILVPLMLALLIKGGILPKSIYTVGNINIILYALVFILLAKPIFKALKDTKKITVDDLVCIAYHQGLMLFFNYIATLIITVIASVVFNEKLGTAENQNDIVNSLKSMGNASLLMFIVTIIFVGPIVEELVFRRVLFKTLRKKYQFLTAAIIPSLIFGALHVSSGIISLDPVEILYILPYAVMSMVMCHIYEEKDNFLLPVGLHIFNNALSVAIALLL